MTDAGIDSWEDLVEQVNAARRLLDDKPRHLRLGYVLEPGSILNAYREGDLSFAEARDVLASAAFREAMALSTGVSRDVRQREVPEAGRDVAELRGAPAPAVDVLGQPLAASDASES